MSKLTIGLVGAALALVSSFVFSHAGHSYQHAGGQGHGHHDHSQSFPPVESAATPEGVAVSDCWIRALPNRLPAAAYFRIQNSGSQEAVLVGAEAKGFGRVMLHGHEEAGGMARMVHVDSVSIAPGEQFEFAPRGHHVMLEQADSDLEIGTRRPLTLWFKSEKALTVQCEVKAPGTMK